MVPAPGYRPNNTGALNYVGLGGYSWASTVSGTYSVYLISETTNLNSSNASYRAYGLQVRCLQAFIARAARFVF